MRYRIGEFADVSGVSAKTLRFYDEIGLLRPASVDSRTRYRYYVSHQLEELAAILALKDLGVILADIRVLRAKQDNGNNLRKLLSQLKGKAEEAIQTATLSLHRIDAALEETDGSRQPMPVILKRRPGIFVASLRAKVRAYTEIVRFERELLKALPPESISSVRGVLWHRCGDSGSLEGEPFVMLKRKVPNRSFYDLKELPPATLACAYSGLDDEGAEQAYDALRRWTDIRGYRLAGPKREIDLGEILEIQFPVTAENMHF
jgi:DNA-binding transcriptional MerR regulator